MSAICAMSTFIENRELIKINELNVRVMSALTGFVLVAYRQILIATTITSVIHVPENVNAVAVRNVDVTKT